MVDVGGEQWGVEMAGLRSVLGRKVEAKRDAWGKFNRNNPTSCLKV